MCSQLSFLLSLPLLSLRQISQDTIVESKISCFFVESNSIRVGMISFALEYSDIRRLFSIFDFRRVFFVLRTNEFSRFRASKSSVWIVVIHSYKTSISSSNFDCKRASNSVYKRVTLDIRLPRLPQYLIILFSRILIGKPKIKKVKILLQNYKVVFYGSFRNFPHFWRFWCYSGHFVILTHA